MAELSALLEQRERSFATTASAPSRPTGGWGRRPATGSATSSWSSTAGSRCARTRGPGAGGDRAGRARPRLRIHVVAAAGKWSSSPAVRDLFGTRLGAAGRPVQSRSAGPRRQCAGDAPGGGLTRDGLHFLAAVPGEQQPDSPEAARGWRPPSTSRGPARGHGRSACCRRCCRPPRCRRDPWPGAVRPRRAALAPVGADFAADRISWSSATRVQQVQLLCADRGHRRRVPRRAGQGDVHRLPALAARLGRGAAPDRLRHLLGDGDGAARGGREAAAQRLPPPDLRPTQLGPGTGGRARTCSSSWTTTSWWPAPPTR